MRSGIYIINIELELIEFDASQAEIPRSTWGQVKSNKDLYFNLILGLVTVSLTWFLSCTVFIFYESAARLAGLARELNPDSIPTKSMEQIYGIQT